MVLITYVEIFIRKMECDYMREMTVSYFLSDEQEERLDNIFSEYEKQGTNMTKDQLFESIMTLGGSDVENKFEFYENLLGLREV